MARGVIPPVLGVVGIVGDVGGVVGGVGCIVVAGAGDTGVGVTTCSDSTVGGGNAASGLGVAVGTVAGATGLTGACPATTLVTFVTGA